MILSVSRRTDIPAFYSKWFMNRIREGYVDVRNPMNIHQVSRVDITPSVVDCVVFWTKNAIPLTASLDELDAYKYYFQYTINPYDTSIEAFVPRKNNIIKNFCEISNKIGSQRMIWRYDPILLTDKITIDYHLCYFEELAKRLKGYTNTCVISFVDIYKKIQNNLKNIHLCELSDENKRYLASKIAVIASKYGMKVQTCGEEINLLDVGVKQGACIDKELIEGLVGCKLDVKKDKSQRKECNCMQSVDIGQYNTCLHLCKYCYANFSEEKVRRQYLSHNEQSPLLIGDLLSDDVVKIRNVKILKRSRELPL